MRPDGVTALWLADQRATCSLSKLEDRQVDVQEASAIAGSRTSFISGNQCRFGASVIPAVKRSRLIPESNSMTRRPGRNQWSSSSCSYAWTQQYSPGEKRRHSFTHNAMSVSRADSLSPMSVVIGSPLQQVRRITAFAYGEAVSKRGGDRVAGYEPPINDCAADGVRSVLILNALREGFQSSRC